MAQDDDAWRQLKTHLETLRRAGLADIPVGVWDFVPSDVPLKTPDSLLNHQENLVGSQKLSNPQHSETRKPVTADHVEPATGSGLFPEVTSQQASRPESRPRLAKPAAASLVTPVTSMFNHSRIPYESPVIAPDDRLKILTDLSEEVAACTRCPHLAATRNRTVFASGEANARLMFIGEAPGADEDEQGVPFVGRAGQLLTDMITKGMGLDRTQVYVANVLKCRPPGNRNPNPDEIANCFHFLDRQIEVVRPEFICLLGRIAVGAILQTALPMKQLRLKWHRYKNIPTMVTYHPAYLLRNPPAKKETWEDLKMLMGEMGIMPPPKA